MGVVTAAASRRGAGGSVVIPAPRVPESRLAVPGVAGEVDSGRTAPDVLAEPRRAIAEGLAPVRELLRVWGVSAAELGGKQIRPLLSVAGASSSRPEGFWHAVASVQLAHEASLLHDDVIDGASQRRGEQTLAASRGVAVALVEGDHLLTSAYRLAALTGSVEWLDLFTRAVERTVAGEKAQGRAVGRELTWGEYEEIVLAKSGELLGAALAVAPVLRGDWDAHRHFELGRRLGLVYQMLDDLLDYSPHVETGKPAMADHARGLWTWPLAYVDLPPGLDASKVAARFRTPDSTGVTPLERCLDRLREEARAVSAEAATLVPGDEVVTRLLREWLVLAEQAALGASPVVSLPPVDGWGSSLAVRARSFHFASRLFPAARREQVRVVYAWCRYTDDLVDGVDLPPARLEARLDAWLELSRQAYHGPATGNDLADAAMSAMREAGVPFGYAEELIEGMRMDVRDVAYGTMAELRTYTFRVASVVGLWMTELFGIRDPWLLDRAAALGHAMQLTNIVRDVGEDLRAGRLYLPEVWLAAHGLDRSELEWMMSTGVILPEYARLVEFVMGVAEAEYEFAAPAIRRLPGFFRRPVAVAADVYRGIHEGVRENGYDNLTKRARTGPLTKLRLAVSALWRSRPEREGLGRPVLARLARLAIPAVLVLLAARAVSGQEPVIPAEPVQVADAVAWPAPWRVLSDVGDLWLQAVEDADAVALGLAEVERTRERWGQAGGAVRHDLERLLAAYEGSFLALRARHGGGPRERLRLLREGFAMLDAAVAADPAASDVRYIRLMTGFYLPRVFGRRDEVRADLGALADLLPSSAHRFPPALYPEVVRFVLEHGDPDDGARSRLEGALR
jgi:15-cis-phytoene synthase